MKTAEAKTTATTIQRKANEAQDSFFQKEGEGTFFAERSLAHNTAETQPFFSPSTIQPKLTIGQPDDQYEQEADAVADTVVQRLADPQIATQGTPVPDISLKPIAISTVQRKCSACEEKERLQKKEEEGEETLSLKRLSIQRKPMFESGGDEETPGGSGNIQRKCASCGKEEEHIQEKSETSAPNTASSDLQSQLSSSKGGGSPLPQDTQSSMSSAFGTDFSGVRIHTDSQAVQMNKELGAQAFTHGSDIYFNAGKFDTNSTSGKHLLAHELTHTVQQGPLDSKIQRYKGDEKKYKYAKKNLQKFKKNKLKTLKGFRRAMFKKQLKEFNELINQSATIEWGSDIYYDFFNDYFFPQLIKLEKIEPDLDKLFEYIPKSIETRIPQISNNIGYSIKEDSAVWEKYTPRFIIEEKLDLDYDFVKKQFIATNGNRKDIHLWIKRCIINKTWVDFESPPDIREIKVNWIIEEGEEKEIPIITALNYDLAFAEAGRIGLKPDVGESFYWAHPIYGITGVKQAYDHASNEAYNNFYFAKKLIDNSFFDELLYITGEEDLYNSIMKIPSFNDKLLSDKMVVLVTRAEEIFYLEKERVIEKDRKEANKYFKEPNGEFGWGWNNRIDLHGFFELEKYKPDGLMDNEFIEWVKNFKKNEKQQAVYKAKKEAEIADKLYNSGVDLDGRNRRYVREGRELIVDYGEYNFLVYTINKKDKSSFFYALNFADPYLKRQQDTFYLLTAEERIGALNLCVNANWLSKEEEQAVASILRNTPDNQKKELKLALEKGHKKLYNALLEYMNDSPKTMKEFFFESEKVLGYSDLNYVANTFEKIPGSKAMSITSFSIGQVRSIEVDQYSKLLSGYLESIKRTGAFYGKPIVTLINYASEEQRKIAVKSLTGNNLENLILLKKHLDEVDFDKLINGDYFFDDVAGKSELRGVSLESLLIDSPTFLAHIKDVISGKKIVEDFEWTYSIIPEGVLNQLTEFEKASIVLSISWGGNENQKDEETILRILESVLSNDNADKKHFFDLLKIDLESVRYGIDGDNNAKLERLISTLDNSLVSSLTRIENVDNASRNSKDHAIGKLSDEDMKGLSIKKRTDYLDYIVGKGDGDSMWFKVLDFTIGEADWDEELSRVGYRDEISVIKLINNTPHHQVLELNDYLYLNYGERFNVFQRAIDGAEFKQFHQTLEKIYSNFTIRELESNPQELLNFYNNLNEMKLLGKDHKSGMPFSDPGTFKFMLSGDKRYQYDVRFIEVKEGEIKRPKVSVTYYEETLPGVYEPEKNIEYNPMDFVVVEHLREDSDLSARKGERVTIPAVGLFFLENKQTNRQLFEALDYAVIILSIATLGTATSVGAIIWAAVDIGLAVGNLLVNSYKEDLPDEVLEAWMELNAAIAIYQIARLGPVAISNGKRLINRIKSGILKAGMLSEKEAASLKILAFQEKLLDTADEIRKANYKKLKEIRKEIVDETRLSSSDKRKILKDIDTKIEAKQSSAGVEDSLNKQKLKKDKGKSEFDEKQQSKSTYNLKGNIEGVNEVISDFGKFANDDIIKNFRQMVLDLKLLKKFPYLTIDELTAIRAYTSNSSRNGKSIFYTLNEQLRVGKLDGFNKILHDLIKSALNKMPKHESNVLYRGIHGKEAVIASKWKKGDKVFFKEYKSTSTSMEKAAYDFSFNKGDDIFLEIRGATGTEVCKISCIPDELEILLNSGQKFEVIDIKDNFMLFDFDYSRQNPFTKITLQAL